MTTSIEIERMAASCLCGQLRLITRYVTKRYDEALRPFGIQASQFNLLTAIGYASPLRRSKIAQLLHLEPSTLTRNLRVMLANGWIQEVEDHKDRRAKLVEITDVGLQLLLVAEPAWRTAQSSATAYVGAEGQALMLKLSQSATTEVG